MFFRRRTLQNIGTHDDGVGGSKGGLLLMGSRPAVRCMMPSAAFAKGAPP